jgi:hypothetical protein
MNDIVWYIVYSPEFRTHIISPILPPSATPYVMKENVYVYPYPAIPAIFDFVATTEQIRNGGDLAQNIAIKVTMKVPAGGPG